MFCCRDKRLGVITQSSLFIKQSNKTNKMKKIGLAIAIIIAMAFEIASNKQIKENKDQSFNYDTYLSVNSGSVCV